MSSSTHKAVLRRSVHAVAAIALGTGLLAGLTAAAVVTTTPTPASAAASQTQNCAISSGGAYEYNQLQNGTTLAPFMLFNGTAISPTAGDTISVACTGLSGPASDSSLLTGVTSPLAAFVDKFSTAGTYGLNMFLGGGPTFAPTDNGPARTTAANNGSLGASSGGIVEASYLSAAASAGATTLSLAGYRTGSSNGAGLPVALPSGSTLFIGCVASGTCAGTAGLYETVTTTAAYTAKAASISVTGLANAYAIGTPVIVPFTYAIPSTGASDPDASCPPAQAQVNIGLTNCAFAVADTNVDEYGFAYINFTGQPALPATATVPGFSSDTTAPPSLTVTNVTNSIAGALGGNTTSTYNGTSSALPGDVVELDSVSGAAGQFWGDPYGSGPLPLTIEVIDSNGTQAPLNSIDTMGQSSGLLSIVPDVYYPTGTSISCGTTCTPTGNGSPGTYTGGELANNTSGDTWNPSSAGQATDEVIPTEGYNPTANAIEALVPGALTYLVVEPNSAPVNDSPYDITTATCGAQCPLPATTPITQIGTLSAAAGPGPTSPYPFTILHLSSPLSLSSTIPPGYPLLLNDPSTSTSEVAYTQESMHNGDTTIAVTNADPGNHLNGDGTTGEGLDNNYTAGTTVSLTLIPNPEGAIGVASGTLEAPPLTSQTINFTSTAPNNAYIAGPTYTVTATGGGSGNPVTFTIDSTTTAHCSISGAVVSFTAAGSCTIDANQAGNSTYAAATEVQQTFPVATTDIAPGAPTLTAATPGSASIALSWTAAAPNGGPATEGYNVYEGSTSGGESASPVNGATLITGTTYTVTGLTNGDKYYFTVKAVNSFGSSVVSTNELSATPLAPTPSPNTATVPDPPTELTAKAGNAQVFLSWTASFDGGSAVEGYNIYESTTSGGELGTPVNGTTLITGTTYTVTGLTNSTKYFFTVDAVNSIGSSGFSNEASATPTGPPSPPPPTSQCSSYAGTDAFLCAAYEDLLGRAPDSAGLAYWGTQLSSGLSRSTVAFGIATSTEARDILVTSYYQVFLNRAPDSTGLSYWVAQLSGGSTDESVIAGILGSPEFYSDSGGTADGFLTASYEDLLGRAPDSAGLTYWERQLSSGASPSSVIAGILSSPEYRTEFVEGLYQGLLGRTADAAGLSYWVGQLSSGVSDESVISSIIGSAEYYTEKTG